MAIIVRETNSMNGYEAQKSGQSIEQTVQGLIEAMSKGEKPGALAHLYLGEYQVEMQGMERFYIGAECHGKPQMAQFVIEGLLKSGNFPKLKGLVAGEQKKQQSEPPVKITTEQVSYPPLPEHVRLGEAQSLGACDLLDQYWVPWSRTWSPRAYDTYHEMTGIFLLSALALGRIMMNEGGIRSTNLYCLLAGRTGQFAKSTTAELVRFALEQIGLDWILCDDDATPQKFLTDMTLSVATNYEEMSEEEKRLEEMRLGFAGQKAWIYDEFGSKIDAIARQGGFMAEYRKIFRTFDASPKYYKNATQGRGKEIILRPYLSLLGSLTPKDVRTHAVSDATMWGDGFLARFLLACPTLHAPPLDDDRPRQPMQLPLEITQQLKEWHERLGAYPVIVMVEMERKKQKYIVIPPDDQTILYCHWTDEAYKAYKAYERALRRICLASENDDLDGNYMRLPEYGVRVAMLFAAFNNGGSIELRHWARAQTFIEHCREGLHHFYAQVNIVPQSVGKVREDAIVEVVKKLGKASVRDVVRSTREETAKVRAHLQELERAGMLSSMKQPAGNNKDMILYFVPESGLSQERLGTSIPESLSETNLQAT